MAISSELNQLKVHPQLKWRRQFYVNYIQVKMRWQRLKHSIYWPFLSFGPFLWRLVPRLLNCPLIPNPATEGRGDYYGIRSDEGMKSYPPNSTITYSPQCKLKGKWVLMWLVSTLEEYKRNVVRSRGRSWSPDQAVSYYARSMIDIWQLTRHSNVYNYGWTTIGCPSIIIMENHLSMRVVQHKYSPEAASSDYSNFSRLNRTQFQPVRRCWLPLKPQRQPPEMKNGTPRLPPRRTVTYWRRWPHYWSLNSTANRVGAIAIALMLWHGRRRKLRSNRWVQLCDNCDSRVVPIGSIPSAPTTISRNRPPSIHS